MKFVVIFATVVALADAKSFGYSDKEKPFSNSIPVDAEDMDLKLTLDLVLDNVANLAKLEFLNALLDEIQKSEELVQQLTVNEPTESTGFFQGEPKNNEVISTDQEAIADKVLAGIPDKSVSVIKTTNQGTNGGFVFQNRENEDGSSGLDDDFDFVIVEGVNVDIIPLE